LERKRILIVEDSADLARVVQKALNEEGFETAIAPDVESAIRRLEEYWNVVLLDLMLGNRSGESVIKFLDSAAHRPAILVLTAKNQIEDKLALFRQGCDDYLTKPFDMEELLERVQALLRRGNRVASPKLQYFDLALDPTNLTLHAGNESITLTPKETSLCQTLLRAPEQVVSRKEILESVWGLQREPQTNFLGVHLLNLRRKFSQIGREAWLQTVRSVGFVIRKPEIDSA